MKKRLASVLFTLLSISIFADRYQIIDDVKYDSDGITKDYALQKAIKIDFERIFESYEELNNYMNDLQQRFNNERVLSNVIINRTYDPIEADDITHVHLRILTTDSKHFLAVPYPKYKSDDGLTLKIKMKDTNFLGTMEELNFDINYQYDENKDHIFGINFDYDYPFALGPLDVTWNNNFGIDFTIGKDRPEFDLSTGFTFVLPMTGYDLQFDVTQSMTRDFDYTEYDDELYYTTDLKFSVPIKIAQIDNWGDVKFSPYVEYAWYWDKNGINELNDDLSSPTLTVGNNVSTGRVNWIGNFRKGLTFEFDQSIGYNYQRKDFIPSVGATVKGYYAFKYVGINTRLNCFAMKNGTKNIGADLRGIRDDQKYKSDPYHESKYYKDGIAEGKNIPEERKALNVPSAIVWSLDIPIHIITTDWVGWCEYLFGKDSWFTDHMRWTSNLDFELQLAPFGDLALTYNYCTDKTFSILDGFYAAGIEALIYPAKWRSLVVRGSVGIDAGRKILDKVVDKLIDTDWRKGVSALEIYIGIGLQY